MNEYHNWQKDNRNKYLIPFTPQDVYKDEWIDWPDFLGHYRLSYKELSDLAIQNNIGGHREYYSWIKKIRGNTCGKYPSHPGDVYQEWTGWYDFLGKSKKIKEPKPVPVRINYMLFEDAKKLIADKNFHSMYDYRRWVKSADCDVILPATPTKVYKKQWKGWPDFLGHNRLPYNELSNMAIQNGINGRRGYYSWIKKIRGDTRGKYPRHPQLAYPEWKDWDTFLGKTKSSEKTVKSV